MESQHTEGGVAEGAAPQGIDLGFGAIDPAAVVAALSEFTRENPHTALAGAAAVGFLLGGGLTPRLVGAVALFASRRYVSQMLRQTMEDVLQAQLGGQAQSPT